MFYDIGRKIKTLVSVVCWIGIIASIVTAIILFTQDMTLWGFVFLIIVPLLVWISCFVMYGFGELIDKTDSIDTRLARMEKKQASSVPESRSQVSVVLENRPQVTKPQMTVVSESTPPINEAATEKEQLTTLLFHATVTMGSYKGEPIEWRVLAKGNGRKLVISKKGLTCQPFHSANESVMWENSSIRSWLNTTFFSNSFDEQEQSRIIATTSNDKIFLLSADEAENLFSSHSDRKCVPTQYALQNGVDTGDTGNLYCSWWLRTPGVGTLYTTFVRSNGSVVSGGCPSTISSIAVRPAMWIKTEE